MDSITVADLINVSPIMALVIGVLVLANKFLPDYIASRKQERLDSQVAQGEILEKLSVYIGRSDERWRDYFSERDAQMVEFMSNMRDLTIAQLKDVNIDLHDLRAEMVHLRHEQVRLSEAISRMCGFDTGALRLDSEEVN